MAPQRPSTEAFHLLLALAHQPRHGYGLMLAVERSTEGRVRIQTGALYRHLKRLLEQGWIEEAEPPADADSSDSRRRYYRITAAGRAVAAEEAESMRAAVSAARAAKLLPGGGS